MPTHVEGVLIGSQKAWVLKEEQSRPLVERPDWHEDAEFCEVPTSHVLNVVEAKPHPCQSLDGCYGDAMEGRPERVVYVLILPSSTVKVIVALRWNDNAFYYNASKADVETAKSYLRKKNAAARKEAGRRKAHSKIKSPVN